MSITAEAKVANKNEGIKKMAKIEETEFDDIKTKVDNEKKEDWDKIKVKVIDDTSAYYEFSSETDPKDVVKLLNDLLDYTVAYPEPMKLANALLPYALEQAMLQDVKAKKFIGSQEDFDAFFEGAMAYNNVNDESVVCSVCGTKPKLYLIKGSEARWFRFDETLQRGVCIWCVETENPGIDNKEGFVKEWHKGNDPNVPPPEPATVSAASKKNKG